MDKAKLKEKLFNYARAVERLKESLTISREIEL